jgi:predicted nucleotidyltransferase
VAFGSLQVPILTVEDLIVLKTLAGRLQDQADLEKIRARQKELGVDWDYVERWKIRLDLRG